MTADTDRRTRRPRLAVWKFASCDGCQLTLLDCEDELLDIAGAGGDQPTSSRPPAPPGPGPYDLSLVEGSVTTRRTQSASSTSGPSPAAW